MLLFKSFLASCLMLLQYQSFEVLILLLSQFDEFRIDYLGIDLRRRYHGVSQQSAHHGYGCSVGERQCGRRVTAAMKGDSLVNASRLHPLCQQFVGSVIARQREKCRILLIPGRQETQGHVRQKEVMHLVCLLYFERQHLITVYRHDAFSFYLLYVRESQTRQAAEQEGSLHRLVTAGCLCQYTQLLFGQKRARR